MHQQPQRLDENSTIEVLLRAHPAAARVLLRHGMACVGCAMAPYESLAEAAREYHLQPRILLEKLRIAAAAAPEKRPVGRARSERVPNPSHPTPRPRRDRRREQRGRGRIDP
jgi:hybrid cluster-associated redox disulfide protein